MVCIPTLKSNPKLNEEGRFKLPLLTREPMLRSVVKFGLFACKLSKATPISPCNNSSPVPVTKMGRNAFA